MCSCVPEAFFVVAYRARGRKQWRGNSFWHGVQANDRITLERKDTAIRLYSWVSHLINTKRSVYEYTRNKRNFGRCRAEWQFAFEESLDAHYYIVRSGILNTPVKAICSLSHSFSFSFCHCFFFFFFFLLYYVLILKMFFRLLRFCGLTFHLINPILVRSLFWGISMNVIKGVLRNTWMD